jgi:hypothetical protein
MVASGSFRVSPSVRSTSSSPGWRVAWYTSGLTPSLPPPMQFQRAFPSAEDFACSSVRMPSSSAVCATVVAGHAHELPVAVQVALAVAGVDDVHPRSQSVATGVPNASVYFPFRFFFCFLASFF